MMKKYQLFICVVLCFWASSAIKAQAQNGDQILDGIGETGLIARYLFDGDVKDWSRNNWHGKIEDSKAKFVNDEQFGRVLYLLADNQVFVSIPGEALSGEESVSITGWIFMRSKQKEQCFFDFGKDVKSHLYLAPMGTKDKEGLYTEIIRGTDQYKTQTAALEEGKWNHVAVVVNIPSKSISTYINGVLALSLIHI